MFDLGWSEMAIIMLVALIVIGPKDLPKVARTLGQWTGKARALARDFQRSLDDMAREAELDEIKKTIDRAGSTNFKSIVKDAVDPNDDIERAFDVEGTRSAGPAKRKASPKATPSNVKKKTPALPPATATPTVEAASAEAQTIEKPAATAADETSPRA